MPFPPEKEQPQPSIWICHRSGISMAKACEKKPSKIPKRRTLSVKSRKKGFSPIEMGLLKEEAAREAQRCLELREGESCDVCSLFCPDLCITRDDETGEGLIDL